MKLEEVIQKAQRDWYYGKGYQEAETMAKYITQAVRKYIKDEIIDVPLRRRESAESLRIAQRVKLTKEEKTCSTCFYADDSCCQFAGEIHEDYSCEHWGRR